MDNPFDADVSDSFDDTEAFEDEGSADALMSDDGFTDSGDFDGFDHSDNLEFDNTDSADDFTDSNDSADAMHGEDFGDDFSDADGETDAMALWNAFEEDIADGLDAGDEDEFLGRILGGLSRVGGMLSRGLGGTANVANRVARGARRAGQIAGQAGAVARRISPAAHAAARLARVLGARRVARGLNRVGHGAQNASQWARSASGLVNNVGQTAANIGQEAQGGQALIQRLTQMFGGGTNEFDDFDALADLYDDGIDAALPGMVALATRAAARGLGYRNVAQLSAAGRRALVRGVSAAARELANSAQRSGVRALPRLAHAAARASARNAPTPQAAAQTLRRRLPQSARSVANNPQVISRAARPLTRPTSVGRGLAATNISGPRTLRIQGPATLTITPLR